MTNNVDIYYGVASGQQRAALRRLEPEGVMISHATHSNTPIDGDYSLFVDCGGYHHMMTGDGTYGSSDDEYLAYLEEYRPDWWALRDYPCEPDLLEQLGRSVRDQQRRTLDHHVALYESTPDSLLDSAVSVIQGWTTDQYLTHLDDLRDRGLLTDRVAIGSVCRRNADQDIARAVLALRDALPPKCELHAFGVKGSVLRYREVVSALDSVDSAAYDYSQSRIPSKRSDGQSFTWRDSARAYLNWRNELHQLIGTESLHEAHSQQTTLDGASSDTSHDFTTLSDVTRVCVCGEEIPPYGSHKDWEPTCRHCHRTALSYWDRELAEVDA